MEENGMEENKDGEERRDRRAECVQKGRLAIGRSIRGWQ
jgi:hypothetical protein